MHVGHLRTTIVGDAIARVLEFAGHRVIRDNHVGDWGTPFGMLIEHLLDVGEDSAEAALLMTDPNAFYQAARRKFDTEPEFTERARSRLVRLQAGDPDTLAIWQRLVDISKEYLHQVYARLGVTLTDDDIRGESFYNDMLADTVSVLEDAGIATVSDGALCAFPAGFTGREGRPLPLIIRKSDGGYNYATTDLAAVRYRVDKLSADRSIYVVGSEQALHFQMVFAVAREAGWIPESASFEHAQIGMVLGQDGNRLKTREGETPKLSGLLQEGVDRARGILDELDAAARFDAAELDAVAEAVGIGAVKYADLSTARESAYLFDWDRMISFRGNTGPYLQYATARIRSIFRRAADTGASGDRRPDRRRDRRCGGRRPHGGRRDHRGPGAGAGAETAQFRRDGDPARRDRGTAPPVRVPVRRGQLVHHVLRGVPGAQGGARVAAGQSARALRAHAGRADQGS